MTVRSLIFNRKPKFCLTGVVIQAMQWIQAFLFPRSFWSFYDLSSAYALNNRLWKHSCDGHKFYLKITVHVKIPFFVLYQGFNSPSDLKISERTVMTKSLA